MDKKTLTNIVEYTTIIDYIPEGFLVTYTSENTFSKTLSEEDFVAFKTWIKSVLKIGSTTVEFIKKDGTERKMLCTLDPELLQELVMEEKGKPRKASEEALSVYDLEANAWRSFRYDSVKSVILKIGDDDETE
jgi:hypothetical protein